MVFTKHLHEYDNTILFTLNIISYSNRRYCIPLVSLVGQLWDLLREEFLADLRITNFYEK